MSVRPCQPQIDFSFKHSRVKQYLKEGRALRIETVINKPKDIGLLSRLEHLSELVVRARQVNDRLLMLERAGQGCAIGSALFERIHQPYAKAGQRTGALRFGDQRAMALAGALCLWGWHGRNSQSSGGERSVRLSHPAGHASGAGVRWLHGYRLEPASLQQHRKPWTPRGRCRACAVRGCSSRRRMLWHGR